MENPFVGEIAMFAGNFAPRNWAFCNGQLLPISGNDALFSILGTIYGGDGRSTFGLPNLQGRVPLHVGGNTGTGPGLSTYRVGQKGGQEEVVLTTPQIPSHTHAAAMGSDAAAGVAIPANSTNGNSATPGTTVSLAKANDANGDDANVYKAGAADTTLAPFRAPVGGSVTVGNTGGSRGHNNMQPYLGINYIIALTGIYPSRS